MVNLLLIAACLVLCGLVATAPVPAPVAEPEANADYYLMTKVLSGDGTKGGLYVTAYHTYAGGNDATFTYDTSIAAKGFLNGTNQQFQLTADGYPWGLYDTKTLNYNRWLPVEINLGYGDGTFAINGSGLVSSNPEWAGWLACDWAHGVPQLFWNFSPSLPILSTCAKVELYAVTV